MRNFRLLLAAAAIGLLFATACQKTGFLTRYGIFHVENDTTVVVNGTIRTATERHWENLIEDHPDIRLMVLEQCPGSNDDDANLRMALDIHERGINMHLPADASIESGAVDLYLAGHKRTRELGAQVGVHSWATRSTEGADLPEDDPEHDSYIAYFTSIGMTDSLARAFYFFTLHAASAEDMHYMTEQELADFEFFTEE